jgi:hypothetical protein
MTCTNPVSAALSRQGTAMAYPEDHNECEETKQVDDDDYAFDQRKLVNSKHIADSKTQSAQLLFLVRAVTTMYKP